MRWLTVGLCVAQFGLVSPVHAADEEAAGQQQTDAADRYMELGTEQGVLGGEEQKTFERRQIKEQIKTFIPPLLRPAFTQHAFVLPPGTFSLSVVNRYTEIDGDDFSGPGSDATFKDFEIKRNLTDFDLFYGFDLDRKYLHGFTARVNVPLLASSTDGFVHPNGQQFISLENAGSTLGVGDVGLFLKKKVWDQGTRPFGFALVGAVFFPTGDNDETFGSHGRITAKRPAAPGFLDADPEALRAFERGFDAFSKLMVERGVWGDGIASSGDEQMAGACFFRNFNESNRGLCDGPAPGLGGAFGAPAAAVQSFAPGGANFENAFVGDFPFNDGVFGRFSGDGRLPSTLQPGTGGFSFLVGGFLTRQFNPGDLPGRSALHLGATHRFVSEKDGIDFGDTTTFFASAVKPLISDLLAVDFSFVGFYKQDDSYDGKIPEPEIHPCTDADVANGVGPNPMGAVCSSPGTPAFVFELIDRPDFSGGLTAFIAPSLILSPDPQIRITFSGLIRVVKPDLGPAPPWVVRGGLEVIF